MQRPAHLPPLPSNLHPPLSPSIPLSAVQSLLPRIATTINDIDSLKAQIAAGNQDGTLPSWDTLLQRYSLLLARINAISSFLSPPITSTGAASSAVRSAGQAGPSRPGLAGGTPGNLSSTGEVVPELARYLVHPLNPLPLPRPSAQPPAAAGGGGGGGAAGAGGLASAAQTARAEPDISPLAPETFFQVINTLSHPLAQQSQQSQQSRTLPQSQPDDNDRTEEARRGEKWHAPEDLRRMDEPSLQTLLRRLKEKLGKESVRARVLGAEVGRREEEVDWGMRIDEEGEDADADADVAEEEKQGKEGEGKEEEKEDEEDLFGDEDGDDGDVVMLDARPSVPAGSAAGEGEAPTTLTDSTPKSDPNPRQGWTLSDYVRFMDTGRQPQPRPIAPAT